VPPNACSIARKTSARIIVIGAQHKRFRDETIIGTTTERRVRFARVPVLTVRAALPRKRRTRTRYSVSPLPKTMCTL
jgi:hypothetical protein